MKSIRCGFVLAGTKNTLRRRAPSVILGQLDRGNETRYLQARTKNIISDPGPMGWRRFKSDEALASELVTRPHRLERVRPFGAFGSACGRVAKTTLCGTLHTYSKGMSTSA